MKKTCTLLAMLLILGLFFVTPAFASTSIEYGRQPNPSEGQFVTDGTYGYYFRHSYEKSNGKVVPYAIMKQPLSGGVAEEIYTLSSSGTMYTDYLNYLDGWLYFCIGLDGEICKIKTDGTGFTCIHVLRHKEYKGFSCSPMDMLIINDRLYYTFDNNVNNTRKRDLIELNLNTLNATCIYTTSGAMADLTAFGKNLFWVEGNIICKYNIETHNITKFTIKRDDGYKINASNLCTTSTGKLYIYDVPATNGSGEGFFSFNQDGTNMKNEKIIGRSYTIINNDIYYWENGHIYKESLHNNVGRTKITDREFGRTGKYFTYHNGYIYAYDFDATTSEQLVKFYKVGDTKILSPKTSTQSNNNVISSAVNSITATPTSSTVLINGIKTDFDSYNIDGSNYFKLRDLAYALNGSNKQFEVSWNEREGVISLISQQSYSGAGGVVTNAKVNKKAIPNDSPIYLNNKLITLVAYNIDNSNYFKLRDIGEAFDFGIAWDGVNNIIMIDTLYSYGEEFVSEEIKNDNGIQTDYTYENDILTYNGVSYDTNDPNFDPYFREGYVFVPGFGFIPN